MAVPPALMKALFDSAIAELDASIANLETGFASSGNTIEATSKIIGKKKSENKKAAGQAMSLATNPFALASGDKYSPLSGSIIDAIPGRIRGRGRLR